jgi:hypothetical protein
MSRPQKSGTETRAHASTRQLDLLVLHVGHPAVDREGGSGDERGFVAQQECRERSYALVQILPGRG